MKIDSIKVWRSRINLPLQSWDWPLILIVSALARLLVALYSEGLNHPDEVFSVLEPAYRLVHGHSVQSWEWKEGIRSYALPYFYSWHLRVGEWLGLLHPKTLMLFIRAVTSLWSLVGIWAIFQLGLLLSPQRGDRAMARICALLMGLWWAPLYFSVRTLSEPVSTNFFLLGLLFFLRSMGKDEEGQAEVDGSGGVLRKSLESRLALISGLLLGLCFTFRFQMGFMSLALFFCYLGRRKMTQAASFCLGVGLMLLGQGFLDLATWGSFWHSPIHYFLWNVVQGGASRVFGEAPWHRYLTFLIRTFTLPGALLLVYFSSRSWRGKGMKCIWTCLLLFWLVHQGIGHKEDRFLFPLVPLLFLTFSHGLLTLRLSEKWRTISTAVAVLLVMGNLYKIRKHNWNLYKDVTDAFVEAHEAQGLQGLLVYGTSLSHSGGYTYLRRNVPLNFLEEKEVMEGKTELGVALSQEFNYVLLFKDPAPLLQKLQALGRSCRPYGSRLLQCQGPVTMSADKSP